MVEEVRGDHKRAAVERLIPVGAGTTTITEEKAELSVADNLLKVEGLS